MSYDAGMATTSRLHMRLLAEGQQLLDQTLCVYWTPHSPQSFMPTCCAALGVDEAERNILGRWAQNQSDTYVWLQRTLEQKLQLLVVSVIRGRDDVNSVLAEGETLQEIEAFLEKREMDQKSIKKQLCKLDRTVSPAQAVHCIRNSRNWKKTWCSWVQSHLKKMTSHRGNYPVVRPALASRSLGNRR